MGPSRWLRRRFFVRDLAFGDVVSPTEDEQGDAVGFQVLVEGRLSTVWALCRTEEGFDALASALAKDGVTYEGFRAFCLVLLAIDLLRVETVIEDRRTTFDVSMAFPCLRHGALG